MICRKEEGEKEKRYKVLHRNFDGMTMKQTICESKKDKSVESDKKSRKRLIEMRAGFELALHDDVERPKPQECDNEKRPERQVNKLEQFARPAEKQFAEDDIKRPVWVFEIEDAEGHQYTKDNNCLQYCMTGEKKRQKADDKKNNEQNGCLPVVENRFCSERRLHRIKWDTDYQDDHDA